MVISSLNNDKKNGKSSPTARTRTSGGVAAASDPKLKNPQDESLRPATFDEIVGREKEKKKLKMMIGGAKKRGESVDHILFYGPPGLGKTTFALAIANEIGGQLKVTSGPAIERPGDLASILSSMKSRDVLFIDEIHRLSRSVEEILYPAMEDFVLDVMMGKGTTAKSIRLNLEPFTLIGATTQIGRLSAPLRDRFGLLQRLEYFSDDEVEKIIVRAAQIYQLVLDDQAVSELAKRARGTGRVALRLVRRVRDFYEDHSSRNSPSTANVTKDLVESALELLGIDQFGLEEVDRKIIKIIYEQFDGGPVGLSTLAAAVSEDEATLSDVHEPFLMKVGLIKRGVRGRLLTKKGLDYLIDSKRLF